MGYVKSGSTSSGPPKTVNPLSSGSSDRNYSVISNKMLRKKGIYVDFINGHLEHIHCLVNLKPGQTIDNILMLIKGESSFWINQNRLSRKKFEWQNEYFAVSVSESAVERVRAYIRDQEKNIIKRKHLNRSTRNSCVSINLML